MSTGYTAAVYEGQSFQNFTRSCAKAFAHDYGPGDGYNYYQEWADEYKEQLNVLLAASDTKLLAMRDKSYNDYVKFQEEFLVNTAKRIKLGAAMLDQVMAWQPSTSMKNLKKFMISQLREDIAFEKRCLDSRGVDPITPLSQWVSERETEYRENFVKYTCRAAEYTDSLNKTKAWHAELERNLA